MKYIRRYETNNEFENDYYGDAYVEPWVSYTKGNYQGFIGQNTSDGSQSEYYFLNIVGEDNLFHSGRKKSITAVDTSSTPCAITVDGKGFGYSAKHTTPIGYNHIWMTKGDICLTKKQLPAVGDDAIYFNQQEGFLIATAYPVVGDIVSGQTGNTVEVISIITESINKLNYNKRSDKNFNFQPLGEYTIEDFGITKDIIDDWINIISKPDFQVESLSNVMVMSEPIIGANYIKKHDYSERIKFDGSNYFTVIYIDDGRVIVIKKELT